MAIFRKMNLETSTCNGGGLLNVKKKSQVLSGQFLGTQDMKIKIWGSPHLVKKSYSKIPIFSHNEPWKQVNLMGNTELTR